MKSKYIILCLLLELIARPSLSLASANAPKSPEQLPETVKVIFHVDSAEPTAFKKTLRNIENLLTDQRMQGRLSVELLANSGGHRIFLKGNGFEKELKELSEKGVTLAECENTLRELKVSRESLYSFISYVPTGVAELAIKQNMGWAYIHPSP